MCFLCMCYILCNILVVANFPFDSSKKELFTKKIKIQKDRNKIYIICDDL